LDEEDLKNCSFETLRNLPEPEWRMWVYFQFRDVKKQLGWILKLIGAVLAAVFGLKFI
jgi:hypothetical protein